MFRHNRKNAIPSGINTMELIDSLQVYAKSLNICILFVTDNDPIYSIAMSQDTLSLFGWESDELVGKPLKTLLPEEVHEYHAKWMRDYKASALQAIADKKTTARGMSKNKTIPGIRKDGTRCSLRVSINYEPELDKFVALCQDESDSSEKLFQARKDLSDFLNPVIENTKKFGKWAIAKITVYATAISLFITQVTPLGSFIGTIWKASSGAVKLRVERPEVDFDKVEVNELISFDQLKINLTTIREKYFITRRIKGAIAVAYYQWETTYDRTENQLKYWSDSDGVYGNRTSAEIWFYDSNSDYDERERTYPLEITLEERIQLNNLDCFWKDRVAKVSIDGNTTLLPGVVCPTWQIVYENGLKFTVATNVAIMAVDPNTERDTKTLGRLSKFLFSLSPSLEPRVFREERN